MADSFQLETESSTVKLLVYNDYYLDIILLQKIEVQPGLFVLSSKLGWIFTGQTSEPGVSVNETNVWDNYYSEKCFKVLIMQFLLNQVLMETIGTIDNQTTKNDKMIKKHFKESLTFVDRRYQVMWPWKEENPELPVKQELAFRCLRSN